MALPRLWKNTQDIYLFQIGKVNDQRKHKLNQRGGKEKPTARHIIYMDSDSQSHQSLESSTKINIWGKNNG